MPALIEIIISVPEHGKAGYSQSVFHRKGIDRQVSSRGLPLVADDMAYSFRGGTHVREHKITRKSPIEKMTAPPVVYIPMSQNIGAMCTPLVAVGDRVLKGQKIGDVENALGCPVHSSVSGTVKEIRETVNPTGQKNKVVVIENDFEEAVSDEVIPFAKTIQETSTEEIVDWIRKSGISGMGGASFPTYAKISSAIGKVDTMIINCAECEPYITANHRLLLEDPKSVLNGAKIIMKALKLRTATFAVEDNKFDAVHEIDNAIGRSKLFKVAIMKTKYPQGDERQLIFAITGKEIPQGKLPADVGCVVFNAETCAAVYRAFSTGMPLIERIVTVSGDCLKEPKNLLVLIGTPYSDLVEFCGGFKREPEKIINGGPMMGMAQWDINAPVTRGTSAVLFLSGRENRKYNQPENCIKCGRCVRACPMHLMPNYIVAYTKLLDFGEAENYGAMSCVECGSCSYNCPAHIPIVQYIKVAKNTIRASKSAAPKN